MLSAGRYYRHQALYCICSLLCTLLYITEVHHIIHNYILLVGGCYFIYCMFARGMLYFIYLTCNYMVFYLFYYWQVDAILAEEEIREAFKIFDIDGERLFFILTLFFSCEKKNHFQYQTGIFCIFTITLKYKR